MLRLRFCRLTAGQRLRDKQLALRANRIAQMYPVGDAPVVYVDIDMLTHAALIVEDITAQLRVAPEHIFEQRTYRISVGGYDVNLDMTF